MFGPPLFDVPPPIVEESSPGNWIARSPADALHNIARRGATEGDARLAYQFSYQLEVERLGARGRAR